MVALIIILTTVVLLLAVLVAGLLRSHADILRALHSLGAGVGDPSLPEGHEAQPVPVSLSSAPSLPAERSSSTAPTIAGVTPGGDALAVTFTTGTDLTLLAFLSTGCATCAELWRSFETPGQLALPDGVRLVVVTKGPEMEIPGEVLARAPAGLDVLMSTEAWGDFEVPGSPFFVLVDGRSGKRIGEGTAQRLHQVADLVRRAQVDAQGTGTPGGVRPAGAPGGGSRSRAHAAGLDGAERESANDQELMAAGIRPGDPSLYPGSLAAVFGEVDADGTHG